MSLSPDKPENSKKSDMPCLIRSHSVLEVRGEDASKFLQGQCSADIEALEINQSVMGAICTVKGRVVSSFFAHKTDTAILLVMPLELVSITQDYLKKYAAFFKVDLAAWTHDCVVSNPETLVNSSYSHCQIHIGQTEIKLGLFDEEQSEFLIKDANSISKEMDDESDWLEHILENGWVILNAQTTEKYLPHPLNLDLLEAVNFKKGCYTGQEIIARTQYRGQTKRRVQLLCLDAMEKINNLSLPANIHAPDSDRLLGEIINLNSQQNLGLALLPVEIEPEGHILIQNEDISYKTGKLPFTFD